MEKQHLTAMILERAARYGDKKALFYKKNKTWRSISWKEMGEMIGQASRALLEFGTEEQGRIAIFSQNRPEWTITDYAAMGIRAITVTIYATNTAQEAEYIIDDAQIPVVFVGGQLQYDNTIQLFGKNKYLKKIIVFDDSVKIDAMEGIMYFKDFLEMGKKSQKAGEASKRLQDAPSSDVATIIYTSGTTGGPKGVMLTHANFYSQFTGLDPRFELGENDIELCFLPFSHAYQKSSTHWTQTHGVTVYYCENTKEIMEHFQEARPTFMVGVPRLYEKMYATVYEKLEKASPLKKAMFRWAIEIGKKYQFRKFGKKFIDPYLGIRHTIARGLVLKKIRDVMGGRLNFFSAGGAPLSKDIEEFFFAAGIFIAQGYGLTETSPVITCNYADKFKFGTPGSVISGCQVKIADDGEILARGDNIMKGYYNRPEQTKEAFTTDGWFMTGDIGFVDEEGFLHITDRKKDIIITAGGKNVSPQNIESLIGQDYYIEQIAIIGDKRKYVSALVVPAFDALEGYCKEKGISFSSHEELVKKPEIIQLYRQRIDSLSETLAQYEKIKKFSLLSAPLSQDRGEITPTLKIKRKIVGKNYENLIEGMYKE